MRIHVNRRTTTRATALCAALLLAGTAVPAVATAAAPTPGAGSPVSAAGGQQRQDHGRGTLVSAERLYRLAGPEDVAAELTSAGFEAGTARYGVDAYRLVYRTVDAQGRPTTASGLLVLPRGADGRLRPVSFAHGTGVHKSDAPSMQRRDFLTGPPVTYASAGFAAVAPDYLGMGTGPGLHPWMDVPSETTASLDMLRAARAFAPRTGHTLDREVAVTGFSQGASAALGLARSLRAGEDRWFRLGALAPVSGAYDFGGSELRALLDGRLEPKSSVIYAAYTLVAFNRLHRVYDSPGQVFRAPYAKTVEALFDGAHTGRQLMEGTPDTLDKLLTPHGRRILDQPTGGMAAALRTTDGVCTDWAPRVPTRLYLARGDEQATVENTAVCHAALRRQGVDAPVIDLGAVDYEHSRHLGSNVAATADIVRWLRTLR
ncbi:lipase [Streptomyces sp. NA02950]|uniref:alpha/beta hydrolase family protein n=1 Tax=Streptomyces sp. NA02950 TaxID=2742137 RepID=UPI0015914AAF|nr:lipase family protein [Streptomyces sp. NA02950]QKV92827.1 lipase [Streptomyces sp. NA02950]